jgi:PAS domain-containing protein
MSEIRVQLHSWLRLQREALPLAVRADALRRTLQACPEVRQAFFLGWQVGTGIYSHEGAAAHLPPGFGDPLQASDLLLFERLQDEPRLSLGELRQLPCWLAGRVRRAAISHVQALSLELDPGQPGLLLIELQDGVGLDWLGFIHELLLALLASLPAQARGSALLGSDPQPSLLLDAQARPLQLNAAMLKLLDERPLPAALELLPVNAAQLVRACLQQGRAIDGVEAQVEGQILIWLFIPDPQERQVLARCRLATEQVQAEREAAKASRLYRLITENTTDLISRHTPEGRFLDASPASWTLLGYWPEELRGTLV